MCGRSLEPLAEPARSAASNSLGQDGGWLALSVRADPAALETGEDRELGIVKALEEDIIFGRLAPGSRLTEDMLLARLG